MARSNNPEVRGVCRQCGAEQDIVGTKEAATVLGVSPSQFQNLKARSGFPDPWSNGLGQGALWWRSDLTEWKEGRKRQSVEKLLGGISLDALNKGEQETIRKLLEKANSGA
jgi:predicted DNA-binding transcriptional regulator AlpA